MTNDQIEAELERFAEWNTKERQGESFNVMEGMSCVVAHYGVVVATEMLCLEWAKDAWLACAEEKQAEIEALKQDIVVRDQELEESLVFGRAVEDVLRDVPYTGSHIDCIKALLKEVERFRIDSGVNVAIETAVKSATAES